MALNSGYNEIDRMLVGTGVYSGIIRVFYGSELALTKRIRIGVKR
jgi:hypothetical protein